MSEQVITPEVEQVEAVESRLSKLVGRDVRVDVNTTDGNTIKGNIKEVEDGWLVITHDAGIMDKAMVYLIALDQVASIAYAGEDV